MVSVFMGGTCNGSKWRNYLKYINNVSWFDPVVDEWNEEAYRNELKHREEDDYCLYVLTPLMTGFYSIAELVDDSNKRPNKVIFSYLEEDNGIKFTEHQLKSLEKTGAMVKANGGIFVPFMQLVDFFKSRT